ncbi:MAG: class I SAM-dependent methyltransferase [Anaerolineaceae bacterium]|nr:class I SAM-dependent methyltransferase [Anaerolineaceae bacterium]
MYDSFSVDYDRFVNWKNRLTFEMPFIETLLRPLGEEAGGRPVRILDAAAGTGMHAIELARRGYEAAGADLSAGMIERARANAAAAGVHVRFEAAGFGDLHSTFFPDAAMPPFDAVLCLGNSIPHLLSSAEIQNALTDFAACLRPGGLVLIQNRNFDAVAARSERWMEPQSHREDGAEWIFLRFYDFLPDGLINFNIITLHRAGEGGWQQQVSSTGLYPLREAELTRHLSIAGFAPPARHGSMTGEDFNPEKSGNLVAAARKL